MLILQESYRPRQLPVSQWAAPARPVNFPVLEDRDHYLCTVYGFSVGGFEASVRLVDLQALIDSQMRPRGRRKPVEDRREADMVSSVQRSKRALRRAVKEIGCDHLLTVTTREKRNSPESLALLWKAFVRRYRFFAKDEFPYVAVPERHPSNPDHWHLHVATRGKLKLSIARQMWWFVCGGRGMGNIDVKFVRVGCDPKTGLQRGVLERADRIARYISKYMTKDLCFAHRPDKKRYWRSEFTMPEGRRYWLEARPGADGVDQALSEFLSRFNVSLARCSLFVFPDGSGFWLSYNPQASPNVTDAPVPF